MGYQHDIFISYRRTPTVGRWVKKHFAPRLQARLEDIAPFDVRLFYDENMEEGVNLTEELKGRILGSSLLLSVWSAAYFRSAWCMAEWQSFREREVLLGMFTAAQPQGLVYPIRYADGENFHPQAKATLCRKDFSSLNYPDDAFEQSAKYLEFDDLVRQVAGDLVQRLAAVPPWSSGFPIVEPQPMEPVSLKRPVI